MYNIQLSNQLIQFTIYAHVSLKKKKKKKIYIYI